MTEKKKTRRWLHTHEGLKDKKGHETVKVHSIEETDKLLKKMYGVER